MNKKNLLISTIFAVFIVTILAVISYSRKQNLVSEQTTANNNPTPTEFPVDTLNDGVYTNYKYGFRFEYPETTFPHMFYKNIDLASFYEKKVERPGADPNNFVRVGLDLVVRVGGERHAIEHFEKISNSPIELERYSTVELKNLYLNQTGMNKHIKIQEIVKNSNDGFISFNYTNNREVETSYGFNFSILKDDLVITIGTYYVDDSRIDEQFEIINHVVNSFEFIQ